MKMGLITPIVMAILLASLVEAVQRGFYEEQLSAYGFPVNRMYGSNPAAHLVDSGMNRRRSGAKNQRMGQSGTALDWPEFFDFGEFENTRHQSFNRDREPSEYPEIPEYYQEREPEIPQWYSNDPDDNSQYLKEPEPVKPEPPQSIQDQLELIKPTKHHGLGGDVSSILNLFGLTNSAGKSALNHKPNPSPVKQSEPIRPVVDLTQPKQVAETPVVQTPAPPVHDLRGHILQPKRTISNTVKILMGIPPVYESMEDHMKRHQKAMKRQDQKYSTLGQAVLKVLTNGKWPKKWLPAGLSRH